MQYPLRRPRTPFKLQGENKWEDRLKNYTLVIEILTV